MSARSTSHSRYIARVTSTLPRGWAKGDSVYLGNLDAGKVEWQHVIICAGRQGGEWVYDSHTAARRRDTLGHRYPAHFSEVRFCRIADEVSYEQD